MHLTQAVPAANLGLRLRVSTVRRVGPDDRREAMGFAVSAIFVCFAAVRDVYLGGLFQRASPLLVAMVAFGLCTIALLPVAVIGSRSSLVILGHRRQELLWVNLTSAGAWLAFLYALRLVEPSLVQILYSGIGPLSVIWIERHLQRPEVLVTRLERLAYFGLLVSLIFSAAVALSGLSGARSPSFGSALVGVTLAACGGVSISVSTMVCRRLNDAGVTPGALLSLRYPATALAAAILAVLSPSGLPYGLLWVDAFMVLGSLLIIVPSYVNQLAISLASPLTVRVVLAVGPVLIFVGQLVEGRLTPSPHSLTAAVLYAVAATSAGFARHRGIHSA
jgi:drug/metabolite transporter (DMT)-like permease